jgi:hypothetical protein
MIKKISLYLTIIGFISVSCNKEDSIQETLTPCPHQEEIFNLKSQSRSYSSGSEHLNVWEYNSQDWEIGYKEYTDNNLVVEHKNYNHDNNGNIIYYERFVNQSLNRIIKRTYTGNNLMTSDSVLNSQGSLTSYKCWKYNSHLVINYKWIILQPNHPDHLHEEYKNYRYDDNNLIQYDVFDDNGHNLTTTLTYNEKGLLNSKRSDRVWDNYTIEEKYEYNNHCLLTDKKIIIRDELSFHWTNYEHNSNGSYIYREAHKDGTLNYSEERTFQ